MIPQRTRLLGAGRAHLCCSSPLHGHSLHSPSSTQPQTSERPKTLTDTSRKGRRQTVPQVRLVPQPPRKAKPAVWTHAIHRLIARGSPNKEPLPRQPEPPRAQGYSELCLHMHLTGLAGFGSANALQRDPSAAGRRKSSSDRHSQSPPGAAGAHETNGCSCTRQGMSEVRERKWQISGRKWAGSLTLQPMARGRWELLQISKATSRETLSRTTRELARPSSASLPGPRRRAVPTEPPSPLTLTVLPNFLPVHIKLCCCPRTPLRIRALNGDAKQTKLGLFPASATCVQHDGQSVLTGTGWSMTETRVTRRWQGLGTGVGRQGFSTRPAFDGMKKIHV